MARFIFKELGAGEEFDPLTLNRDVPFTQARFYGQWQTALGRKVRRLVVCRGDEVVACLQLIKYPFARGWNYLYAPYGPVVKNYEPELLLTLADRLRDLCQEEKAVFARLDFTPKSEAPVETSLRQFFRPASLATYHSAYFQPRTEWFLDLEKTPDQMLLDLDKKTRYSIKQSEKAGVTTEIIDRDFPKYFADFYRLMSETAKRNHFQLHPKKYYEQIFQQLEQQKNAFLVLAKYQGQILVINLIIIFGQTANYVFSGASSEHRELSASYLAQWHSITESAKRGAKYYNFGGVAANEKMYHGWQGLTLFKKKFGGYLVTHTPFYDLVAKPLWYWLYNLRKWLLARK